MMNHAKMMLAAAALAAWWPSQVVAGDGATPQEVIAKVREATAYLEKQGAKGLKTFDNADSPYVWKDTYVFVYNCAAGLADIATPVATIPEQKVAANKDATGKVVGPELCKAAERPGGGWVEYMWYKPTRLEGAPQLTHAEATSRKVSYMLAVKGQPFQVGAGIYNDTLTVAELDAMLKK
jgi:signal transduction histidine kinase